MANDASAAGTIRIGDLTVPRMGFGAMRLPGPGVWGPPADRDEAIRVVRRAVELGVRVIDTAWYYGLDVANEIIAAALRPYPEDLVLVTKLGGARRNDGSWHSAVTPAALREGNARDRRVLDVDSVPVTHLRWMDTPSTTFEEALGAMVEMREDGLIQRIGLSNVTPAQFETALAYTEIATVSNQFGIGRRDDAPMIARCASEGIAYLPFFPLGGTGDVGGGEAMAAVAAKHGATQAQISIAWLLATSPALLPIPGTGRVAHLDENVAAAGIVLDPDDLATLGA